MKPAYSYYTDKMWRFFIPRLESSRESGIKPVFHNKIEQENYEKNRQLIQQAEAARAEAEKPTPLPGPTSAMPDPVSPVPQVHSVTTPGAQDFAPDIQWNGNNVIVRIFP